MFSFFNVLLVGAYAQPFFLSMVEDTATVAPLVVLLLRCCVVNYPSCRWERTPRAMRVSEPKSTVASHNNLCFNFLFEPVHSHEMLLDQILPCFEKTS